MVARPGPRRGLRDRRRHPPAGGPDAPRPPLPPREDRLRVRHPHHRVPRPVRAHGGPDPRRRPNVSVTMDLINGCLELGGALLTLLSVRQVLRDRMVRGVHWGPIVFFTGW